MKSKLDLPSILQVLRRVNPGKFQLLETTIYTNEREYPTTPNTNPFFHTQKHLPTALQSKKCTNFKEIRANSSRDGIDWAEFLQRLTAAYRGSRSNKRMEASWADLSLWLFCGLMGERERCGNGRGCFFFFVAAFLEEWLLSVHVDSTCTWIWLGDLLE